MKISSLLPYVMPEGSGIHLNLNASSNADTGKAFGGFSIVDEPDQVTRLHEAGLSTDAGSPISRLFLLTQKSDYNFETDELKPFNNMDVELCWQRAFSFYAKEDRDMPVHIFAEQKGKGGILLPFNALFYCRQKKIYFHPPCHKCGFPLTQCHDDDLLDSKGLQLYSTSLKRYLFCPSCCESQDTTDFYVSRIDDQTDPSTVPAIVKGKKDLIREFGNIKNTDEGPGCIPCASCDRHAECFGSNYIVDTNIVPFSFYPFYMLAFDAGSLNAVDLLSLLSGVQMEDLSKDLESKNIKGRKACVDKLQQQHHVPAFFFKEGDDRRLLEILYLKLSFLGEVFTLFFSHLDNPHYPNPRLSLNRIWIKLNDNIGLLPYFWNFNVMHFGGILGYEKKSLVDRQALPFYKLYYMGMSWFYALLVNKKQDISIISNAIDKSLEIEDFNDEKSWCSYLLKEHPTLFSPENCFETFETFQITQKGEVFFNEAVCLGLSLIRAGLGLNVKWSEVTFDLELKTLRERIGADLFAPEPYFSTPIPKSANVHENDVKIREIVVKIKDKLSAKEAPAAMDLKDQDIAMETVILQAPKTPDEPPDMETVKDVDEDEDLDKTMIYRPDKIEESPKETVLPQNLPKEPAEDDILSQTVMPGSQKQEEHKKVDLPFEKDDDDDLSKTLIIRNDKPVKPVVMSKEEEDDEDLNKTRIIRQDEPDKPLKKNLWGEPEENIKEDDDLLDKTVIIRPDKNNK